MTSMIEQRRRQLEKETERKCVQYATDKAWMPIKTDLAARGWPDRLFFGPSSQLLIVEFKRPGYKPTKKQQAIHDRLAALGHPVSVIFEFREFRKLIDASELLNQTAS